MSDGLVLNNGLATPSVVDLHARLADIETRIAPSFLQKCDLLEGRIGLLERFMVFFDTQKLDSLMEMVGTVELVKSKLKAVVEKLMTVDIHSLERRPEIADASVRSKAGSDASHDCQRAKDVPTDIGLDVETAAIAHEGSEGPTDALSRAHAVISAAALAALEALGACESRDSSHELDSCEPETALEPRYMDEGSDSTSTEGDALSQKHSASANVAEGLAPINETFDEFALHHAVNNGNVALVERLIEAGFEVDELDSQGDTALHRAAYNGNKQLVVTLLRARADVDKLDRKGKTPLRRAYEDKSVVDVLLAAGANPNARDKKAFSTLHRAAEEGRVEVMQALLRARADPNLADEEEMTPLHTAAMNGKSDAIEVLISARADVHSRGSCGNTPLLLADWGEHGDACNVLLRAGANATECSGMHI